MITEEREVELVRAHTGWSRETATCAVRAWKQINPGWNGEYLEEMAGVERDTVYGAAVELVWRIDEDLRTGRRHFRDRDGRLLETLDQVIQAILDNDLQEDEHDQGH